MFKEILRFSGKDWVVTLTRRAMIEIEELQRKKAKIIANDEDSIELIAKIGEIDKLEAQAKEIDKMEDGKAKEKELNKYMKKYLPLMIKMQNTEVMGEPITPYELIYILIHNYPKNDELRKEDYEAGLFELEETLGLIELEKKVRGISDKVFRDIELVKKTVEEPTSQAQEQAS